MQEMNLNESLQSKSLNDEILSSKKTKTKSNSLKYLVVIFTASLVGFGSYFGFNGDNFQANLFNTDQIKFGFFNNSGNINNTYTTQALRRTDNGQNLTTTFKVDSQGFDNQNQLFGASGEIAINIISPSNTPSTRENIEKFIDLSSINIRNADQRIILETNFNTTVNPWPSPSGNPGSLRFAMVSSKSSPEDDGTIRPTDNLISMDLRIKKDAPVGSIEFILTNGNLTSDPSLSTQTFQAPISSHRVLLITIRNEGGGGGGGGGGVDPTPCTENCGNGGGGGGSRGSGSGGSGTGSILKPSGNTGGRTESKDDFAVAGVLETERASLPSSGPGLITLLSIGTVATLASRRFRK